MKKLMIAFATAALAIASAAARYNVTLYQPSFIEGTNLKPGDYKIEVIGDRAVFKLAGKEVLQTSVTLIDNPEKVRTNTIIYQNGNISAICVGGSHTKLVFGTGAGEIAAAGH